MTSRIYLNKYGTSVSDKLSHKGTAILRMLTFFIPICTKLHREVSKQVMQGLWFTLPPFQGALMTSSCAIKCCFNDYVHHAKG